VNVKLGNNNRRNDNGNRDTKLLCATALTSEEKGNCAIKQETLKRHPPLKLADLACDKEFRTRGDCQSGPISRKRSQAKVPSQLPRSSRTCFLIMDACKRNRVSSIKLMSYKFIPFVNNEFNHNNIYRLYI